MDSLERLNKFLKYLEQGHLLKVEGRTYGMDKEFNLYCLPYKMNGSEITDEVDESHPLGLMHLPLKYWIEVAEKIPEDQFFIMAANMTLNEINRKKRD